MNIKIIKTIGILCLLFEMNNQFLYTQNDSHHESTHEKKPPKPASNEEKQSLIKSFLKSVEEIPKETQSNQKEYKQAIDKGREEYKKMYEVSTKRPLQFTQSEHQQVQTARKNLYDAYKKFGDEEYAKTKSQPNTKPQPPTKKVASSAQPVKHVKYVPYKKSAPLQHLKNIKQNNTKT